MSWNWGIIDILVSILSASVYLWTGYLLFNAECEDVNRQKWVKPLSITFYLLAIDILYKGVLFITPIDIVCPLALLAMIYSLINPLDSSRIDLLEIDSNRKE